MSFILAGRDPKDSGKRKPVLKRGRRRRRRETSLDETNINLPVETRFGTRSVTPTPSRECLTTSGTPPFTRGCDTDCRPEITVRRRPPTLRELDGPVGFECDPGPTKKPDNPLPRTLGGSTRSRRGSLDAPLPARVPMEPGGVTRTASPLPGRVGPERLEVHLDFRRDCGRKGHVTRTAPEQ